MSDRKVQISFSRNNNGTDFGAARERSLGELGEQDKRVRIARIGHGRCFLMKVRCTSPMKLNFMGAVADVEKGD